MGKLVILGRLQGSVETNVIKMICVLMLTLLTSACAKQASHPTYLTFQLPMGQELTCRNVVHDKIKMEMKYCGTISQLDYLNETGRVSKIAESDENKKNDLQEIECRVLKDEGSKTKTKYCAARAFWPYAYVCNSEYCECNEDHQLECRIYIPTGSKIPTEFCRTKALWAEWEKMNGQFAKDLLLDISNDAAVIDPEPIDPNKVPQFK